MTHPYQNPHDRQRAEEILDDYKVKVAAMPVTFTVSDFIETVSCCDSWVVLNALDIMAEQDIIVLIHEAQMAQHNVYRRI